MAVRRALYLARLRRLGVDGRVIPLLAFLRDGWGWRYLAPGIAVAAARVAEIDRRSLRPSRIHIPADLEDVAAQPPSEEEPAYTGALFEGRLNVLSSVLYGRPYPGTSIAPYVRELVALLPEMGIPVDPREVDEGERLGERMSEIRREWGLTPREVAAWIRDAGDNAAERGRLFLRGLVRAMRQLYRRPDVRSSSNPMSWFGTPRHELREILRHETGRPTISQTLASAIVWATYAAELRRRAEA